MTFVMLYHIYRSEWYNLLFIVKFCGVFCCIKHLPKGIKKNHIPYKSIKKINKPKIQGFIILHQSNFILLINKATEYNML